MRPEETLCGGQVNEATLLAKLPYDTVHSLAMYAVALGTGGNTSIDRDSFRWLIDDACGEGFCDAVEALRQRQEERARRAA